MIDRTYMITGGAALTSTFGRGLDGRGAGSGIRECRRRTGNADPSADPADQPPSASRLTADIGMSTQPGRLSVS
jgi:hypothetical protein